LIIEQHNILKNDNDVINALQPIVEYAKNDNLTEAIAAWLKLRSETPIIQRETSIWNMSIFDAFSELEIRASYDTYEQYIQKFRNACHNAKPDMKDRAPSNDVITFQQIFQQPKSNIPRLQKINKMMEKPKTQVASTKSS